MAALRKFVYEYTYKRRRIGEAPLEPIHSAEYAFIVLQPLFEGAENEQLVVLALNRKHRVIGVERVYLGHVSGTAVRIAELFRFAIRVNAAAIVIAHNHPSGVLEPSADDLRTTQDTVAAGRLLGIDVLDHLILSDGRFLSMGEKGALSLRHR